jgi:hypothetical protein
MASLAFKTAASVTNRRTWAGKLARMLGAAVIVYLILLAIGMMWWPSPDRFLAFLWRRFQQVEKALPARSKQQPSPSPTERSPGPERHNPNRQIGRLLSDLAHPAILEVVHRLEQFRARVHHERTVAGDGLAQRDA